MTTFQNSDAKALVEKNLGGEALKELGNLDFRVFTEYVGQNTWRS